MNKLALILCSTLLAAPALAESPLADAIENGRRDRALELIAEGADVNVAQRDGTTPLHWAAYHLDTELVRRLIAKGARANTANRYGATPLGEAVKAANTEIASALLEAGAEADAANADGETALMLAAKTGSKAVASLLIDAGADVNAREAWRDQTALMWAADSAFPELVALLIEHGADVRARAAANDWGSQITSEPRAQYRPTGGLTPLTFAARSGCTECVKAILGAGEDIDRPTPDGVTALMLAIDNFEFDTAKALLETGANPHLSDWWGRTALYIAVDMTSYLLRAAAHPRSTTTTGMELVNALIAAGVEVNSQLNFHRPGRGGNSGRFVDDLLTTGATPLLRAAIMHDNETMLALLAAGARVDLPNAMGVTPFMAAAGVGVREPTFVSNNRAPDFEGEEIESEVLASLEILLAAGADVNTAVADTQSRTARIARPSSMTDRQGQTALHQAAARGWVDVVEYLLERGANPAVKDMLGRTPLDFATTPVQGRLVPNSEIIAGMLTAATAAP